MQFSVVSFALLATLAAIEVRYIMSKVYKQSWGGFVETDSLSAPLAHTTTSLLENNGAASSIYKAIDQLDYNVDGTAAFVGNVLALPTFGLSKQVIVFLSGPMVQSLTHGTYLVSSRILGDPGDEVAKKIASAAQSYSNSAQKLITQLNRAGIDTTAAQNAQAILQKELAKYH